VLAGCGDWNQSGTEGGVMESTNQIGIDELLPAFQRLGLGVQKFLVLYLFNGRDKVEACRVSHPTCKSPAVLSCQILSRRGVKRVLDIWEQRSAVEATLTNVERLLKHTRRDGVRMKSLIAPLERVAKALEAIAAKDSKGN
jgi:hypothetical protein